MKYFLIVIALLFTSCNKTSSTLNPIQSVGCAVETAVVGAAASSVAATLSCTNQSAIQASLTTALGNVNLCASPIPAPAAPALTSKLAPKWSKVGDVSAGDLSAIKSASKPDLAKPMGIVGSIACPIVVNTVIGFATSQIPSSWACSTSASADTVDAALTAACEAAVPL